MAIPRSCSFAISSRCMVSPCEQAVTGTKHAASPIPKAPLSSSTRTATFRTRSSLVDAMANGFRSGASSFASCTRFTTCDMAATIPSDT
eukprot:scaffold995_cov358-Pavlova_lutheri.AAC.7